MDEEQKKAELDKLRAETELLNAQLTDLDDTRRRSKLWYSPNTIIQAIVAGLVVSAAFFFLFEPIIDAYKATSDQRTELAAFEAKKANLQAQIEAEKNRLLEQENQIIAKALEEENERFRKELKALEGDSRAVEQEKQKAVDIARLKLSELQSEYEKLSRGAATT